MTHYSFKATDSVGRPGTLHVDPEHPIYGHCGHFSLDVDPGIGSMHSTEALTMLTITSGPVEGLRGLAAWARARHTAWVPMPEWVRHERAWADAVEKLAS
jgi:hypothetical protein